MMQSDAKRMAKKVCKRLGPLIVMAIQARPRAASGYTLLQGYRTALALCAAGCLELGMSEGDILDAVKGAANGWRQGKGLDHG